MPTTRTRTAICLLSAGLWLAGLQADAFAQISVGGQGGGTPRTGGGSASGRGTTGAAATGANRTNTSTRASSAGGRAATGRTGGGASNFGETSSLSLDTGATGTQVFGTGMVGRGAQPGGFIGNANAAGGVGPGGRGAPQQFGRTGGFGGPVGFGSGGFGSGGFGQPGGFGGNFRGNGGLGNNLRGGPSTSLGEFRPQMRIAFPRVSVAPVAVQASIAPSLVRLQESLPGTQNLAFDVGDAGVVTVRGVVPTDADRRIAIRMLEMEPGVREVNDQLTVATPE